MNLLVQPWWFYLAAYLTGLVIWTGRVTRNMIGKKVSETFSWKTIMRENDYERALEEVWPRGGETVFFAFLGSLWWPIPCLFFLAFLPLLVLSSVALKVIPKNDYEREQEAKKREADEARFEAELAKFTKEHGLQQEPLLSPPPDLSDEERGHEHPSTA